MAHTSQDRWCNLVGRDFESESLGFEGDYNVWIRAARNHSNYLCNCLDREESVRTVGRSGRSKPSTSLASMCNLNRFEKRCHFRFERRFK